MKLPPGGRYVVSIPEAGTPPAQVAAESIMLEAPAGMKKFTLYIIDEQSGYAARRELETGKLPAEVSLTSADLKLVHRLRVRLTGKEDRPIARATVTLTDSANRVQRRQLDASRGGDIEFEDVTEGSARLEVTPPTPDPRATQEIRVGLQKGETTQTVTIPLPQVTAVTDQPSTATSTQPGTAAAGTGAGAPPPPPAPASGPGPLSTFFQTILGFVVLAAIGFAIYLLGKKQGWTVERAMAKLGVQPQAVASDPGTVGPASPQQAPPPPPVVADPNRCQFCGELKDPVTGQCACSLTSSPAAFAQPAAFQPSVPPAGPRLIGTAGIYMGEIFALCGDSVIGRDVSNSIPLERDTTVSRRHARITPENGGYRIVDEGSSNGTYVNGARVSEARLQPGDEVGIGGTRFRFEV